MMIHPKITQNHLKSLCDPDLPKRAIVLNMSITPMYFRPTIPLVQSFKHGERPLVSQSVSFVFGVSRLETSYLASKVVYWPNPLNHRYIMYVRSIILRTIAQHIGEGLLFYLALRRVHAGRRVWLIAT